MTSSRVVTALVVTACALRSGPFVPAVAAQGVPAYTSADVQFMQGMIHHHAQALIMAAMAPTHGGSSRVRLLCEKITLSQRDEINMMRQWLQFRKQAVPDSADHMMMASMMMPGMLNAEQLRQLDAARDTTFDRLFLTDMIQHHTGALKMVADLIAAPPSGQESEIFRFITDVDADQRAEIAVMQQMLYNLQGSTAP
jgi:uncharacterized protein (DUF305 family)